MKKKIYYHNTDCGGVVYYGEYLKFFEEARLICTGKTIMVCVGKDLKPTPLPN